MKQTDKKCMEKTHKSNERWDYYCNNCVVFPHQKNWAKVGDCVCSCHKKPEPKCKHEKYTGKLVCRKCDAVCTKHGRTGCFTDMRDINKGCEPLQSSSWEKVAKEIIGKWGYEEEYWWKPIAEALQAQQQEWKEKIKVIAKAHDNSDCYILNEVLAILK